MTPAPGRRLWQRALGNQGAQAPRETAQAHLARAQRAGHVAARCHPRLHPLDQFLVLETHAAIDAPVEIACGAHLAARVRIHVYHFADHGLGGGYRQKLHEIDLVRIDVEGDIRPELEVGPQALPLGRQMRDRRQQPLVRPLGPVARRRIAHHAPHLVDPWPGLDTVARAEKAGEARMRYVDVQTVRVVVGDVLPVHRTRPQARSPQRYQLFHAVGGHFPGIRRRHLAHAREPGREPHEDEAHEYLVLDRREPMARDFESGEGLTLRHADEPSIERIGPGVVRAGDAPSAGAARCIEEPRRAMAADIVEGTHALWRAYHHQRLAEKLEGMKVAGTRYIAQVAHELPAAAEDGLALALEELRIPIDPCG